VKKIVDFINSSRELGINVDLKESKSSTISDAIVSYATWINRNHSPAIMLGNVRDGTPGMHYFLIVGYHGYNNEGYGFYLNDSTYNSPAYPKDSPIGSIAIPPRKFVYRTELERYWAKTGSRFTSLRKHMYLYNSATSP
jgi:hypothetical protein